MVYPRPPGLESTRGGQVSISSLDLAKITLALQKLFIVDAMQGYWTKLFPMIIIDMELNKIIKEEHYDSNNPAASDFIHSDWT